MDQSASQFIDSLDSPLDRRGAGGSYASSGRFSEYSASKIEKSLFRHRAQSTSLPLNATTSQMRRLRAMLHCSRPCFRPTTLSWGYQGIDQNGYEPSKCSQLLSFCNFSNYPTTPLSVRCRCPKCLAAATLLRFYSGCHRSSLSLSIMTQTVNSISQWSVRMPGVPFVDFEYTSHESDGEHHRHLVRSAFHVSRSLGRTMSLLAHWILLLLQCNTTSLIEARPSIVHCNKTLAARFV